MTRLPRTIYVNTGSNVIVGGKSPEQTISDHEAGVARIGGFFREPSYVESYLLATQVLIDKGSSDGNLDDLGLPAFYLQRHTLELLLKSVLSWLHVIHDLERKLLDECFEPDLIKREKDVNKHNLQKLLVMMQLEACKLNLPTPPAEFQAVVDKFTKLEKTETWARYSDSRRKGHSVVHHVQDEVVIPLIDLQIDLNNLAAKVLYRNLEGVSYENMLSNEWESLHRHFENL